MPATSPASWRQDQLRRLPAHLVIGDPDRSQRRMTGARHIQIVETGDGELARHAQMAALAFEQHPGRQLVVTQISASSSGQRSRNSPAWPPPAETRQLRGIDDGVRGEVVVQQRLLPALHALLQHPLLWRAQRKPMLR